MGLYEESERIARRAVGLNVNDSRTLAEVGWRLAVKGKFDEGMPLMQEAIDRSADPPGWYFHLLAIDQLLKGDYTAMRPLAERAALSGGRMSQALLAIAASATEDREATVAALSRIPSTWDAEAFCRRYGATEEIVDALLEGLDTERRLAKETGRE